MKNTVVGCQAGDNITTGNRNIIIGADIDAQSDTASDQLNIGNWIERNSTGRFKFSPASQHGIKQRDVSTWETSFNIQGTTATNWDMTAFSEGGAGNCFLVTCGFSHYASTGHSLSLIAFVYTRGTDAYVHDVFRSDTTNNGAFSVSKASSTTLRISKSAGTYTGWGYGFVSVKSYNNT